MEEQNYIQKALKEKKAFGKVLTGIAIGFGALVVVTLLAIAIELFIDIRHDEGEDFFDLIALTIIVIWFAILVGYYAWAIYFYNINLGLTDEDWAEIRERKKFNPEGVNEPKENPNINQTLGLPTGTVRGTVALTLLIGGVAMTIAALGMKNTLEANSFLVDNFEFFKTAFLMMIAFYFGNKSLEMLGYTGKKKKPGEEQEADESKPKGDTDAPLPMIGDAGAVKSLLKKTSAKEEKKESGKSPDADFDHPDAML